jgi:hypothetical protein
MMTMLGDLAGRDPVTGAAAAPVTSMQPLELARWQASPAGQRRSAAALRRWDRLLHAIPPRRFGTSSDPRDPRDPPYWQLIYNSPASHLAARLIGARTETSTSTVLRAAFAVVMVQITGIAPAVVQIIVNNRFRRELAGTVSPLTLPVPCVVDTAADSFDQVVSRAWQRAIAAYQLSYYDPRQRDELIAKVSQERGEPVDLACFVNDRRALNPDQEAGELPSPAQVRAALEQSELTWGWQREIPGKTVFLHLNNVPDTVHYELSGHTGFVAPADLEGWLRGMEEILVRAALHPPGP